MVRDVSGSVPVFGCMAAGEYAEPRRLDKRLLSEPPAVAGGSDFTSGGEPSLTVTSTCCQADLISSSTPTPPKSSLLRRCEEWPQARAQTMPNEATAGTFPFPCFAAPSQGQPLPARTLLPGSSDRD